MGLFTLRGTLESRKEMVIGVLGFFGFIGVWWLVANMEWINPLIFPSPGAVIASLPSLHFEDAIIRNAFFSIKINVLGYTEAIVLALPLGFLIGLVPLFRALFMRYVTAFRALPLTGLIGLFIVAFGLTTAMKVHFLALGIFVYLLPVVVQRIDEVEQIYIDTTTTWGASTWQKVRTVFIPVVLSRVYYDALVIVAISWTYIIIAEVLNKGEGGIGALVDTAFRKSQPDKAFAGLGLIVLIVFVQDKIGRALGRWLFPFRQEGSHG